jgi:hypothetical protein
MADMNSILTAIVADTALTAWNPVVTALPDYELKDTSTAKCCVVPVGIEYGHLSRGTVNKVFVVDVGFIKRQKNVNVLSLITDLESIADHFMKQTYAKARVMNVSHDPLYDADRLQTESLFQGVMQLRLQEVSV